MKSDFEVELAEKLADAAIDIPWKNGSSILFAVLHSSVSSCPRRKWRYNGFVEFVDLQQYSGSSIAFELFDRKSDSLS
jgi:hypothetical protein